MSEVASYERYVGYHLFVKDITPLDEDNKQYSGVAQKGGNTFFSSRGTSAKQTELRLMIQIDKVVK
jgi:hypothetical protein